MKTHLRKSKASGSTIQKIERIVRMGERAVRRRFVAADRATLRDFIRGGLNES